jgi:hypothetical protein
MKKLNLWTKIHSLAALICAAALLVLAGCENVALGDGAASGSKGILKLNIIDSLSPPAKNNGIAASVGGISKTANPGDFGVSYWDAYQVSFENQSGENPNAIDITKEDNRLSGSIITVEVAPGEYVVTITAFKDSVAVAKGVTKNIEVSSGVTAEAQTVAILPRTKGEDDSLPNGTLSYSINLSGLTGLTKKIIYFTQDMTTDKVTADGESQEITLTENTKTDDSASLPPGLYRVWVDLIKNNNWAGLHGDIVYIYSGQTSTLSPMTFTDANFSLAAGDDPENGGVGGGMSFAGDITVTNWSDGFTIAQNEASVTFGIDSSYTDIQWSLNQDNKGTAATFVLNPSEYEPGIYSLLVIAKNAAGQWESSGGLPVTITEEAEVEKEEEIQVFNDNDSIGAYLDALPNNDENSPYTIRLGADFPIQSTWDYLGGAIAKKKYIILDMGLTNWSSIEGNSSPSKSNFNFMLNSANNANNRVVGIIVPPTVTAMKYAFTNATHLKWVKIPSGTNISGTVVSAFKPIPTLTKIIMDGQITSTQDPDSERNFKSAYDAADSKTGIYEINASNKWEKTN